MINWRFVLAGISKIRFLLAEVSFLAVVSSGTEGILSNACLLVYSSSESRHSSPVVQIAKLQFRACLLVLYLLVGFHFSSRDLEGRWDVVSRQRNAWTMCIKI